MKDKSKKTIAAVTWIGVALYCALAYLMYYVPWAAVLLVPVLMWMGSVFLLIPVAMVIGLAAILIPFGLIFVIGYFVDMAMCKLLGVPFE